MQSKHFPSSFYRVTVKGLCVRDGKLLLQKESKSALSGKWEMPGGGLDFGEDIRAGFEREIREEAGLAVSKMSERPVYVWTHRYENKRNMDWYYALALAYRIEFEHLNFTPSPECEELRFFSKDELVSVELSGQTKDLLTIFNPNDFAKPF